MTQLPVGIFVKKGFLLMEYFIENHFGVPFRRSLFSFSYHSPQTVFQNQEKNSFNMQNLERLCQLPQLRSFLCKFYSFLRTCVETNQT